jgi:hypothetical protein
MQVNAARAWIAYWFLDQQRTCIIEELDDGLFGARRRHSALQDRQCDGDASGRDGALRAHERVIRFRIDILSRCEKLLLYIVG